MSPRKGKANNGLSTLKTEAERSSKTLKTPPGYTVHIPQDHNIDSRCSYTEIQRYTTKKEETKDTVKIKTQEKRRKSEEGSDYRKGDKQPGIKQQK
jgi:hypothetical protein